MHDSAVTLVRQIAHAWLTSRHVCVHITHAARVDTDQPGIAKRAGLARFGSDWIAFTLGLTRVNPGCKGKCEQGISEWSTSQLTDQTTQLL